ncbi:hypothetical protein [Variovorax sp. LG9.2]|uniref:hypothetical protein n=1 Tax=Variovorax sp. LG9.2 TaxID=3048626 RepID=UPI002B2270BD|nr:hypothetical protein [Variovorax sp. LG9.2]MEB0060186.1 hypothetical protein [Variovorax sp. LG9.2]
MHSYGLAGFKSSQTTAVRGAVAAMPGVLSVSIGPNGRFTHAVTFTRGSATNMIEAINIALAPFKIIGVRQ